MDGRPRTGPPCGPNDDGRRLLYVPVEVKPMEQNVGQTDKLARIAIGALLGIASLAILGDYVSANEILSPILGVASLVLLATGATGTCGLYSALGIRTD